jgi:hypothetical protein
MPAIQPSRLKKQAAQLGEAFSQPTVFIPGLHQMLDLYADQTHRPGQTGKPPPLLKAYNVPSPVLRQVFIELNPYIASYPSAILDLCDALWAQPVLEFKKLAIQLLGRISLDPSERIIARIHLWTTSFLDEQLIDSLVEHGLYRLRREKSDLLLSLCAEWLSQNTTLHQQLGLRALGSLVTEPKFENHPTVYRLITPFLRVTPLPIRPDILSLLQTLARRSPQEITHLLRVNLSVSDNPDTPWLLRHTMSELPGELQSSLKIALRDSAKEHPSG